VETVQAGPKGEVTGRVEEIRKFKEEMTREKQKEILRIATKGTRLVLQTVEWKEGQEFLSGGTVWWAGGRAEEGRQSVGG